MSNLLFITHSTDNQFIDQFIENLNFYSKCKTMPSNEDKKKRDVQNSPTMSSRTSSIDSSYNIEQSDPQYQDSIQPSLNFSRLAYNLAQFNETFEVVNRKSDSGKKMMAAMRPTCSPHDVKRTIKSLIPITDWLFNYNWRSDFVADFVTGLTIAVFQVPQSMTQNIIFWIIFLNCHS